MLDDLDDDCDDAPFDVDSGCMCEWQTSCHGTGLVECSGCGGDQCICVCAGHAIDCPGCSECPDQHDDCDDDEEDDRG